MSYEIQQVVSFLRDLSQMDQATLMSVGYACYLYIVMDAPNHPTAKRRRK